MISPFYFGFWILDFGFWVGIMVNPKSKIQNLTALDLERHTVVPGHPMPRRDLLQPGVDLGFLTGAYRAARMEATTRGRLDHVGRRPRNTGQLALRSRHGWERAHQALGVRVQWV